LDHLPGNPLQPEFEKRTVADFEQPVGNMDAEIGVDPDQVGVESSVVDFRQRQAVRDDRLP
jgi:hypothetical protein